MKHRQFKPGDLIYWINDEAPGINVFICTPFNSGHIALLVRPNGEVRWRWVDELVEIS